MDTSNVLVVGEGILLTQAHIIPIPLPFKSENQLKNAIYNKFHMILLKNLFFYCPKHHVQFMVNSLCKLSRKMKINELYARVECSACALHLNT